MEHSGGGGENNDEGGSSAADGSGQGMGRRPTAAWREAERESKECFPFSAACRGGDRIPRAF